MLVDPGQHLGPVAQVQLGENVLHVEVHGVLADEECGADLFVCGAAGHLGQHLFLPIGKPIVGLT